MTVGNLVMFKETPGIKVNVINTTSEEFVTWAYAWTHTGSNNIDIISRNNQVQTANFSVKNEWGGEQLYGFCVDIGLPFEYPSSGPTTVRQYSSIVKVYVDSNYIGSYILQPEGTNGFSLVYYAPAKWSSDRNTIDITGTLEYIYDSIIFPKTINIIVEPYVPELEEVTIFFPQPDDEDAYEWDGETWEDSGFVHLKQDGVKYKFDENIEYPPTFIRLEIDTDEPLETVIDCANNPNVYHIDGFNNLNDFDFGFEFDEELQDWVLKLDEYETRRNHENFLIVENLNLVIKTPAGSESIFMEFCFRGTLDANIIRSVKEVKNSVIDLYPRVPHKITKTIHTDSATWPDDEKGWHAGPRTIAYTDNLNNCKIEYNTQGDFIVNSPDIIVNGCEFNALHPLHITRPVTGKIIKDCSIELNIEIEYILGLFDRYYNPEGENTSSFIKSVTVRGNIGFGYEQENYIFTPNCTIEDVNVILNCSGVHFKTILFYTTTQLDYNMTSTTIKDSHIEFIGDCDFGIRDNSEEYSLSLNNTFVSFYSEKVDAIIDWSGDYEATNCTFRMIVTSDTNTSEFNGVTESPEYTSSYAFVQNGKNYVGECNKGVVGSNTYYKIWNANEV
jgi:hypothetical protein